MTGGHIAKFRNVFKSYILFALFFEGLVVGGVFYWLTYQTSLDTNSALGITAGVVFLSSVLITLLVSRTLLKPTEYLAQAIFHVSPNQHIVAAPNIDKLRFGRQLVATLTRQIYDYAAATSQPASPAVSSSTPASFDVILDDLPVSVIGLDKNSSVTLMNKTARETLGIAEPVGVSLDKLLQMKFINTTLTDWLDESRTKSINSTKTWQKVEIISSNGEKHSYFDMAGVIRQGHSGNTETMLVLFDHNEAFAAEEEALGLIALSVHEIRTPLTILRGYIEVLRDELEGKLDAQSKTYVDRLSASSENLASFMANILSVVKADQDQLSLQLQEASWKDKLTEIATSLQTRAAVRGKSLALTIADNLPTVALDTISINEVVTNLVDNAVKYSAEGHNTIWINAKLDNDGTVLTTVRDEGVGIPDSVVPNLFTRFYRNHRNQKQVAGTGLGLFISKEIISAHHGNIWVTSKENSGTTVGFNLIPFSRLADLQQTSDNGFIKVQHGWIKNHSMQRR